MPYKFFGRWERFRPHMIWPRCREYLHQWKLTRSIKRWHPDLIYSNTVMNGDAVEAFYRRGTPVIVHVRELDTFLSQLKGQRLASLIKLPCLYLAVSQAVKNHLVTKYHLDEKRIRIVPPSVNSEEIIREGHRHDRQEIRDGYGLPARAAVIGAIGRADRRKGVDLFIATAQKVLDTPNDGDNIYFMWIGDGPELDWMKAEVEKKGLGDRFIFAGAKPRPYPHLNAIDILFMCSREDPFPRVNLEAATLGKPIVAFRESGGSCEFVEHDCGFVIDTFDVETAASKLLLLSRDTQLRNRFGKNAKKKALTGYKTDNIAKHVADIVGSILKGSNNQPNTCTPNYFPQNGKVP